DAAAQFPLVGEIVILHIGQGVAGWNDEETLVRRRIDAAVCGDVDKLHHRKRIERSIHLKIVGISLLDVVDSWELRGHCPTGKSEPSRPVTDSVACSNNLPVREAVCKTDAWGEVQRLRIHPCREIYVSIARNQKRVGIRIVIRGATLIARR